MADAASISASREIRWPPHAWGGGHLQQSVAVRHWPAQTASRQARKPASPQARKPASSQARSTFTPPRLQMRSWSRTGLHGRKLATLGGPRSSRRWARRALRGVRTANCELRTANCGLDRQMLICPDFFAFSVSGACRAGMCMCMCMCISVTSLRIFFESAR